MSNPYDTLAPGIQFTATTNPGAGTEPDVDIPTNTRCRLLLLRFTLTTDATVANRFVRLQWSDGANNLLFTPHYAQHVASTTLDYYCTGITPLSITTATNYWLPVPRDLYFIYNRHTLGIRVENMQAGDAITTIRALWHVWPFTE